MLLKAYKSIEKLFDYGIMGQALYSGVAWLGLSKFNIRTHLYKIVLLYLK